MTPIAAPTAAWVEAQVGVRLVGATPLVGGMSSEVHRCWFSDGSTLVVRHISNAGWLAREPDLIRHEAAALDLLAETDVPAPRHVASDPAAGLLLMTLLPGTVISDAAPVRDRAGALGEAAASVAAVPLPPGHGLDAWRPWAPADPTPPPWGDLALWRQAIRAYARIAPSADETPDVVALLHRDLHPLNVLWDDGTVVGIVDWVNACVGHPHAELGHCRWNLAVLDGIDAADAFLAAYLARTDFGPYDPRWDLAAVVSLLPGPIGTSGWQAVGRDDLTTDVVTDRTEAILADSLARIRTSR